MYEYKTYNLHSVSPVGHCIFWMIVFLLVYHIYYQAQPSAQGKHQTCGMYKLYPNPYIMAQWMTRHVWGQVAYIISGNYTHERCNLYHTRYDLYIDFMGQMPNEVFMQIKPSRLWLVSFMLMVPYFYTTDVVLTPLPLEWNIQATPLYLHQKSNTCGIKHRDNVNTLSSVD